MLQYGNQNYIILLTIEEFLSFKVYKIDKNNIDDFNCHKTNLDVSNTFSEFNITLLYTYYYFLY